MWCVEIFVIAMTLGAQASQIKTGAEFLNIPVGARPVGMGSAFTALANDVTALYWNPAGLSLLRSREISAMHSQWLLDIQYNFLGFGAPLKTLGGTLAGSVSVLSQGSEESRGTNREKAALIRAQDQVISIGFGKKMVPMSVGLAVKALYSRIAGYGARSAALDLGALYCLSSSLTLGFSIQNIGPGMKFISQRDPLPLTLNAGASARLRPGLALAFDARHGVRARKTELTLGTEFSFLPSLTLRGGYLARASQAGTTPAGASPSHGFSAGVGLIFLGTNRLDYSFTPFGLLGDTHRLSLAVRY
jgi:hypothetical protein